MTTDNRTSEPTEAQLLAGLNALYRAEHEQANIKRPFIDAINLDVWSPQAIARMRAALVAAQGAAPQAATAHSPVHFECDCVPNLGPPHCHACSDEVGNPVMWSACPNAAPVLPSSTVDEGAVVEAGGGEGA